MKPSWVNGVVFCMVLLFWASRLSPVKTKHGLSFSPPQLLKTEGENAIFVCNVSNKSVGHILNWYRKKNGSQSEKLAAYPKDMTTSNLQDRYHIAMKDDKQTYEMTIRGLRLNDSGQYFCGIINMKTAHVDESNLSELNITERLPDPSVTTPSTSPEPLEKFPKYIVAVSVIVGVILLTLIFFWILFIVQPGSQRGASNSESDKDSLKAEPSTVSVSTVVYGQLEFQREFQRMEEPKVGGDDSCEQTEYATIIFPQEKPAFYGSSPHRNEP